jgi:signal transduction histidine kinase
MNSELNPKLLIVDDEPDNIKVLSEVLRQDYEIFFATMGQKALEIVDSVMPDLILLDVVMPEMDGYQVCASLKENPAARNIPVIFVSAMKETEDETRGLEIGAVDYIVKPISPPIVRARIRNHLSMQTARRQLIQAEKMAALGQLVAGVAHEINTPVGVSVTAASYLQRITDEVSESLSKGKLRRSELEKYMASAVESTSEILSNLMRAAELIQSFKQVAVDQNVDERRHFNLHKYIHEILLSLRSKYKNTKYQIVVNCPEDLIIYSYPGAIMQIIANLVMNSLIHGFEGREQGVITIDVSAGPDEVRMRYRDNGKGLTAQEKIRIFEPFFTTKPGRGGTGLGMHIVYNLVTQTLNGGIVCESAPGKGAGFTITLPANNMYQDVSE